jgi:hypothetical protein
VITAVLDIILRIIVTMKLVRIFFATLAGVFVGSLFIYAVQAFAQIFLPPGLGFDSGFPGFFQRITFQEQLRVLLPIILSYAVGALAGGLFAGIVSKEGNRSAPLLTDSVLLVAGLIALINSDYPTWFWISSLMVYLPFAWFGSLLADKVKKM